MSTVAMPPAMLSPSSRAQKLARAADQCVDGLGADAGALLDQGLREPE